jgi:hypothetical protein
VLRFGKNLPKTAAARHFSNALPESEQVVVGVEEGEFLLAPRLGLQGVVRVDAHLVVQQGLYYFAQIQELVCSG